MILVRSVVNAPSRHRKANKPLVPFTGADMKMSSFLVLAVCGVFVAVGSPSGYRMTNQVRLPGAGGWDYLTVDVDARRVYVSHSSRSGSSRCRYAEKRRDDRRYARGAWNRAGSRTRTRIHHAGKADAIVVFDLKTLQVISQVKTGKKPDAIVFDPATNRVFAMNGGAIAQPQSMRGLVRWLERSIWAAALNFPWLTVRENCG